MLNKEKLSHIIAVALLLIAVQIIAVADYFGISDSQCDLAECQTFDVRQKIGETDISGLTLSEVEGWQTYRNEEYGFEMKYSPTRIMGEQGTRRGKQITFSVSPRQSLATFDMVFSPLENMNGYGEEWRDVKGYFNFIKSHYGEYKVNDIIFARSEIEGEIMSVSLYTIHEKHFVQITYSYPEFMPEFNEEFKRMINSIVLY